MTDLLDRVLRLWAGPPADDAAAVAAFRELYTDPVPVNGIDLTAADLVARARSLHAALAGLTVQVVQRFEVAGRIAVVHRHVLDRPYPEIAELMGSSEEAARANVSQGIKKLRELIR